MTAPPPAPQADLRAFTSGRDQAASSPPPYCAFNGGNDVWVDIGNKRVGVMGLCTLLQLPPESVLHVGDQFLNTGNDCAPCGPPRNYQLTAV